MMYKLPSSSSFGSQLVCGVLLAFCMGWLFAQAALGQTYVNNQNAQYFVPGPPLPPQINDTAFVNRNIFSISYNVYMPNQIEFVEPWWGTLDYTNVGTMSVNAPIPTNGFSFKLEPTMGVGFQFDLQEGNSNVMAGTFYNLGTIHCDSVLDGNNIFTFQGFQFADQTSIGGCIIAATNIINPGNLVVGENGQLNLNGQNVDLSRSVLTLEQGILASNNVDVSINSEGEGFTTTNQLWNPFASLTQLFAVSAPPDNLTLINPASYFQIIPEGPSNNLVRAVFIVNVNTNTPNTVYITPPAFGNEGALLQWTGTYLNPATDVVNTNYLYLFHFFFNSTNLPPILTTGTIPNAFDAGFFNNFLWAQSAPFSPLPAPNTEGFQNVFTPNSLLTNVVYEFFNSTLTGTSAGTNASTANPSGALTNLPDRLIINASHELKMNLAQITGPNYMSINATNQFDGSPGALISTPYSDLNLAVTNGYPHPLTISNLLASSVIQWGGTLNEWSTRWTNTDANGIGWDYRVMLVFSDLTPAITPQVQNLTLTASNVVISDVLNVFGSMSANAQSLTLTTNLFGGGATSPDGELNMQEQAPWAFSWSGSFPNLFLLTNNGAIRMPNYATFISSAPVTNGIPTIPAVPATNILIEAGGKNVAQGNVVIVQPYSYTFTNTINGGSPAYFVKIGANFDASLTNLVAAIDSGKGTGIVYSAAGAFPNPGATAGVLLTNLSSILGITNHGFIVTAALAGTPGNFVATSTTATNLMWTNSAFGVTLTGGVDAIPGSTNITSGPAPYGAIINNGFMQDQGATISVDNFVNSGEFTNGTGPFELTSITTTLTNGSILAGADVSLTANTLVVSNVLLQVGRSLTLQITNFITDDNITNGNLWTIGNTNVTGFDGMGLILPFLPANTSPGLNNLLGSVIFMQSPPPNKIVESDWAGLDYGGSTLGYTTNNVAIGRFILNSQSANSDFYFSGPPNSSNNNAIYVDQLVLENYASLADKQGSAGIPTLQFNTNANAGNLTIYYADALSTAMVNGGPFQDVSYILNGLNGGHLVWVPQYSGFFSTSTNNLNIGLVENSQAAVVASRVNFKLAAINVPQKSVRLTWESFPGATNAIYYSTNLVRADWLLLTNFVSPTNLPPVGVWPISDVVLEPYNSSVPNSYYRVIVTPDSSFP